MSLSTSQRHAISREVSAGVPHTEIAQTYGISVAKVLFIGGRHRDTRGRLQVKAEPLPGLKETDWRTARPVPRLTRGDGCQALGCSDARVGLKSYCAGHCAKFHSRRAA